MNGMSFDLEISDDLQDGVDWEKQLPIGISCIGFACGPKDNIEYQHVYAAGQSMSQPELHDLIDLMESFVKKGYTLVSWNGQGFDLPVLYHAVENLVFKRKVRDMAVKHHVDMMFTFLQHKGFPISLQKASEGQGLGGKLKQGTLNSGVTVTNMSGRLAPSYWRDGERTLVLDYLKQDVIATHELFLVTQETRLINWTANSGRLNSLRINGGWLTVEQTDALPEPDTSWMSSPPFLTKERFMDWTKE